MSVKVGDVVEIFSGYGGSVPIATGNMVRVSKTMATVETPHYACPVRYRLTGPLAGRRIIGGLAEYLNDYIKV